MLGETKHVKTSTNPGRRQGGSRTGPGHQGLALIRLGTSIRGAEIVRGTQVQEREIWVSSASCQDHGWFAET